MIKSLTSLRGIFILLIFFHHAGVYPGGGSLGVAFFFVLSGFSMTLGYKEVVSQPAFNYRQYITRRIIKIFPLHWLTLILYIPLVLMSAFYWWMIPVFFINAALLQSFVPIPEVFFSYNAVSWFLSDIFVFALLFPAFMKILLNASNKRRIIIGIVLVILYVVLVALLPLNMYHAILYINPIVRFTDFVFGIYFALLYLDIRAKNLKWGGRFPAIVICLIIFALIAESVLLSDNAQLISPLYWPLLSVLILFASFADSSHLIFLENKTLLRLGECSFTFFLIHRLVLRYVSLLIPINKTIVYIIFCLTVTILLSLLIDHYILKSISQCLKRKTQQSMTAHS